MNITPALTGRTFARWLVVVSLLLGSIGIEPRIHSGQSIASSWKTEVSHRASVLSVYRLFFTTPSAFISGNGLSLQQKLRSHAHDDTALKFRVSLQHLISVRHKLGFAHHKITPGTSDDCPPLIG